MPAITFPLSEHLAEVIAAEQHALQKAGFTLEGVIRAAEFRAGQWRDGYLYSRLRTDPDPLAD